MGLKYLKVIVLAGIITIAFGGGTGLGWDYPPTLKLRRDLAEARQAAESIAAQSTIVKLSLDDAVGLYGDLDPARAIAIVLAHGPDAVVLTDGDRGSWFASRADGEPIHVPAFRVDAVEPTGAGDAFTASLIARLLASQWAAPTASDVRAASAAGALATTRRGAWDGLPTRQQLDAFLMRL